MEITLPLPDAAHPPIKLYIVDADVPLVFGLNYMDEQHLVSDNLENKLK